MESFKFIIKQKKEFEIWAPVEHIKNIEFSFISALNYISYNDGMKPFCES